jgi:hypothetical protein
MTAPSQDYLTARRRMNKTKYTSISQYTEDLIKVAHHKDEDGREIGLDYDQIRVAVLQRFPKVLTRGPHQGKRTKLSVKEIIAKACDLNRNGVRLPFRPRRKSTATEKPAAPKKTKKTKKEIKSKKNSHS